MTLSLTAVFIPLLFMPGVVGRLFHEFAVTISIAILVSGVVSLSLTPMLASRVLGRGESRDGRFYRATERVFEAALGLYRRSLGWVMEHRPVALAFSGAMLVATVGLFLIVPKGFIPTEDTGQIVGTTQAAQGSSFDAMLRYHQQVMGVVGRNPNVAGFMTAIGVGSNQTSNQGRLLLTLKPQGQRPPADQIIQQLRPRLAAIPGVRSFLQMPPAIQIGGQSSSSTYQFQLQGTNADTLYAVARRFEQRMHGLSGVQDVVSNLQITNPQVSVHIDRDRADALGVTPAAIESALYGAFGSAQVSTIYTPSNQYWVVMELLPRYQRDPAALDRLYVTSSSGGLVPLSSVATVSSTVGPLSVNHAGQLPSVTISFNLAPGISLGEAQSQIQALARQALPEGVSGTFAGAAQVFQSAQSGMLFLLVVAVFVIYLVLGILYESFVHPATILTALPFAAFGALFALWLAGLPLDIYGYVGVILLIGIAKKNAIMMIDFALAAERTEGKSSRDSILEAAAVRFRPIMMTTMAALMGALPIAFGTGAGAEARRPLGMAVVGGLAFSQLVTLYVTPVFYTYFDALPRKLRQRWHALRGSGRMRLSPEP